MMDMSPYCNLSCFHLGEHLKLVYLDSSTINIKSRPTPCGLMSLLLAAPVQASTSSQNDFGTSGGIYLILSNPRNSQHHFSGQVSGNGQLIPASDYDYLESNSKFK